MTVTKWKFLSIKNSMSFYIYVLYQCWCKTDSSPCQCLFVISTYLVHCSVDISYLKCRVLWWSEWNLKITPVPLHLHSAIWLEMNVGPESNDGAKILVTDTTTTTSLPTAGVAAKVMSLYIFIVQIKSKIIYSFFPVFLRMMVLIFCK